MIIKTIIIVVSPDAVAAERGDKEAQARLAKLKRQLRAAVGTNRKSEVDMPGPSTVTRQRQVDEVKRLLYEAAAAHRALSLHAACKRAWTPLKGGYPSVDALYSYCHRHGMA